MTRPITDLGTLNTTNHASFAHGINDNGHVVGISQAVPAWHGFFWDPTNGIIDLGDLGGGTNRSVARAINSSLCVVRGQAPADLRFPGGGRTFRGGLFADQFQNFFTAGKSYRAPGFLATSFSEQIAQEFADRYPPAPTTE